MLGYELQIKRERERERELTAVGSLTLGGASSMASLG